MDTGRHKNTGEAVHEDLRLGARLEAEDAARLELLRRAADDGFEDIDAGRHIELRVGDLTDYVASLGALAGKRLVGRR